MYPTPIGIKLVRACFPRADPQTRRRRYQIFILIATFFSYMCYHMTRRPIAIVKPVLNHNGSCIGVQPIINVTVTADNYKTWCDWDPFKGDNDYFGYLDSAYLFSYAVCMFGSGFVAERMHLRYFLSIGMLLSGLTTYLFGLGYVYNIHSLYFFFAVQIVAGGVQSSGWPAVVTLMSKWFGKTKKGLIFGIWNAHTSVGNIVGAFIAGAFVDKNWGLSFIVPGLICCAVGIFIFLFVPAAPEEVGIQTDENPPKIGVVENLDGSLETVPGTRSVPAHLTDDNDANERTQLLRSDSNEEKPAISFFRALVIPGVLEFSMALFFAKLVSYTFLFWLPQYLKFSTGFSPEKSAGLSTAFDMGGIVGGILAGYLSDRYGASATTSVGFLSLSIPMLFVYRTFGATSFALNAVLLTITGFLVNGPYALITTAVSADLGSHPSISRSSNALATVTAIIDGTGSVGAALGPLFADMLKGVGENWLGVFAMVMVSDLLAVFCLLRITIKEVIRLRRQKDMADTL